MQYAHAACGDYSLLFLAIITYQPTTCNCLKTGQQIIVMDMISAKSKEAGLMF